MMNMRDIEFVRALHHLAIDHASANNKSLFFAFDLSLHLVQGINGFCAIKALALHVRQNDIPPVGQGMFGQREEGSFAHHYGLTGRDLLKMLQVRRHVAQ